jgi:colanic acid/amylovoran biosynthesis protein
MRVLIVNGWSDDNKGDAAIVLGLHNALTEAAKRVPNSKRRGELSVGLLASRRMREHDYRFVSARGRVTIYPTLLPADTNWRRVLPRRLERIAYLLRSLLILLLARYPRLLAVFLNKDDIKSVRAIRDSDVVVSKGGHIFYSTGSLLSLIGMYSQLFPLLLAQKLGRPTVVFGQSLGPFAGSAHRWLLRTALSRCREVLAREPLSLDVARELLGARNARIGLTWDTAFMLEPETLPSDVSNLLPPRFVAVTVRQWDFPYERDGQQKYHNYLRIMAQLVVFVHDVWDLPVVLAPQVAGPTELEFDFRAWAGLLKELKLLGALSPGNVTAVKSDLSPGQLMSLYARSELVVGTRFHSVILALAAGRAAVAISYHGTKAPGILKMMGLSDCCLSIDTLDETIAWSTLESVFARRAAIAARARDMKPAIIESCVSAAQHLLEAPS